MDLKTIELLDELYEIQQILVGTMPENGTPVRAALDRLDKLIDSMDEAD